MASQLTSDQFKSIFPHCPKTKRDEYLPFITAAMLEFEITTELRAAAFLAQLAHESGELRYMEEIASGAAYEGRKDLGNTQPGDGKRYKGRGPIQVTGRTNYKKYGDILGIDLINNPELAATPEIGFRLAGAFWQANGLNELADKRQFKQITKRINGGYNGLADRVQYYERALRVLPDDFNMAEDEAPADVEHGDVEPEIKPEDAAKGVTVSDKPASETSGTPPPAPAAEVKASEPSLFTKLGSLSVPAGVMSVLAAIGKFVQGLPPWAWVAIVVTALVVGYLIWRDAQQRAHERTLLVMSAAADKEKNNLRLV
jgi:predicted chitinase